MKQIYYIRHGEGELNKAHRWAGTTDTPLTKKGHEQAKQAGQAIKAQGLHFDIIISSPLQRAYQTACHVAEQLAYPVEDIVLYPNIIERNYGSLENTLDLKASAMYLIDESCIDNIEGVESMADLQKRADVFLKELCELPQQRILIVGHGAFGRALRRAINNEPIGKRGKSYGNAQLVKLL